MRNILSGLVSVVLLWCLLPTHAVRAETEGLPVVDLAHLEENGLNLSEHLVFVEDPVGLMTRDDVLGVPPQRWQIVRQSIPNFGYTESAYWFRVRLINNSVDSASFLLDTGYPLLDFVELHTSAGPGDWTEIKTGDRVPFAWRPLDYHDFLFPLNLRAGGQLDLLLRIQTEGSLQVPLTLWKPLDFALANEAEQMGRAAYYGAMSAMLLYNLFLFIAIRERAYLYYVGMVFSVLTLMAGAHGYLYQYLFPSLPSVQSVVMLITVPATMLFACLFSARFLNLRQTAPRLNQILSVLIVFFAANVIGAFFLPYSLSTRLSMFLALPAALTILFIGPYVWKKGLASARYYTFAWLFLLTGILISASSKMGLLPRTQFTEYAMSWGSAIEAVLLSFALADRFNRERKARYEAQKARLEESEQRKEAETRLYHQATHMTIDGFPNLMLLQQRLYQYMQEKKPFSLMLLQPAGIPAISKTLGHANADIVLSVFSQRLKRLKLPKDELIPIETDPEGKHCFAHLEPGLYAMMLSSENGNESMEYLKSLLQRCGNPVEFGGMQLALQLHGGIAVGQEHGGDISTLLRHARVAMEVAVTRGEPVCVYAPKLNPYSPRRLALMGELNRAIEEDSLDLHLQPIIRTDDDSLVSAEALLRWEHAKWGPVPPDEFVGLAEQTGIMPRLTQWVLQRAISQASEWRFPERLVSISVNISAINLCESDFSQKVSELLRTYDYPAEYLILEVTETAVMKHPEVALKTLRELAEAGIQLAVDDFGVGQTSFSYLSQLPVREIKIDRTFIGKMNPGQGKYQIVKSMLSLCHDLGYTVVAEGVEDSRTLHRLRMMGCDFVQGYLIARPMPADAWVSWMDNRLSGQSHLNALEPGT